MNHLALALPLLLASCARPAPVCTQAPAIPAAVYAAVMVVGQSGAGEVRAGWAAPVALGQLLTVAHLVPRGGRIGWQTTTGHTGTATVLWADLDRDLALLQADDPEHRLLPLIEIADALPGPLEPVHYRYYLQPGGRPVVGRALVQGLDSDNELAIDGLAPPGSSGSPLVNSRGELVGVLTGGFNQAAIDQPTTLAGLLLAIHRWISFRPHVTAAAVVGGIPRRPKEAR